MTLNYSSLESGAHKVSIVLQLHVQAKDCLLKTIGEDAKRLVSDVITHRTNNVYHCMNIFR